MLVHGLIDSSDTWIMNRRNGSVGFILADAGYDVWAVNTRGNKHSRSHKWIDADNDYRYWERAGMIEIAKYDLSAFLEFILSETKAEKLTYVGHSMATQEMIYNLATNASFFAPRITGVMALGPIGEVTKIDMVLNRLMNIASYYMEKTGFIKYVGGYETYASEGFFGKGTKYICAYVHSLCDKAISFIAQSDNQHNDLERLKVYLSHYPAGSSYKAWSYIWETFLSGKFAEYDMGSPELNLEKYG
jgi:pimeloyl-ACP methyl ester carboxylesterase